MPVCVRSRDDDDERILSMFVIELIQGKDEKCINENHLLKRVAIITDGELPS